MKVVITTMNNRITSKIPVEFNDAQYFLFLNSEQNNKYSFIPNMFCRSISGAEIFCSNYLINQEIELFVCGVYSKQASELLTLAGIKVIHMPNSTIRNVIKYINKQVIGGL